MYKVLKEKGNNMNITIWNEFYHEKVKVWNLSVSITRPVVDTKFSDFAIALDSIQDKYNVLICKSAGNCRNFAMKAIIFQDAGIRQGVFFIVKNIQVL